MSNKKKIILIEAISVLFILIILITILSLLFKSYNNAILSDSTKNTNKINNSFLTLMLEQSDGTYKESKSNKWPTGNYAFNGSLSSCENGGKLKWDREQNVVKLLSNKSDKCYVYFDLYNVVQISNVSTSSTYNSITITVTTSGGENAVDKYFFSIDGGNSYQESASPTYTFSNLTSNYDYEVQVYARDTEGYVSNEEVVEVTTDNYVSPVVNSITVTDTTTSSISVSVSASGGTNSVATYYYSINNGTYTSSSSNTHTFSGLSKGTTYSIKVYVKDTNGVDSAVKEISAETINEVFLADVCSNGTNLATCIKNYYNEAGAEMSGIYYHTSSLANSAADNSYRYAGANPNNYVCFGSDASTCPSDNLYRIIGVFGNEVKLIKATSYGSYMWNSNGNQWSSSNMYNVLNGTYGFIYLIPSAWQNKISTHKWKVGGMSLSTTNVAKKFYDVEVGSSSSSTTSNSKIGLMYVSDFGFAASKDYWTTNLFSYYSARNSNWLAGLNEWTISRDTSGFTYVYSISNNFVSTSDAVYIEREVRPSFYLISSTIYVSGSGSSTDPIRIS